MRFLRSRTFLFFVLLIGLPILWRYWIADLLAELRWQEYADEAKARGLRWTLAEYRPPAVSPEEDAALLPVFASPTTFEAVLQQVPPITKGRKRKDGAPPPIDWKAMRKSLSQQGLRDDPAEADDLRALDAAARVFRPLVDQLLESRATAGNWGDSVWKVDLNASFPHSTTAMRCFSLLRFRANLDLALGRPVEARRAVEAQLRLARVFSKKPTLLLHFVAVSGLSIARETVWRGLENGAWDDPALRAFATEFLGWNTLADFQWSMETERAWSRELDTTLLRDPQLTMQVVTLGRSPSSKINEWMLWLSISRPAWHRDNQLWYERAQDELATMIDTTAGVWRPIVRQFEPEKLSEAQREVDLALAAQSMGFVHSSLQKSVWIHAQNKMAAIACALELARRAKGKYPDTLEALVPAYLPHLPIDPATGVAFRYAVQPDGTYRLYSVGFDREDQGGKLSEDSDRHQFDPDWPWFSPDSKSSSSPP